MPSEDQLPEVLVTGTAGFIGFHMVRALVEKGYRVTGLDSVNDYYDVDLKFARLEDTGIGRSKIVYGSEISSTRFTNYSFIRLKLEDREGIDGLFREHAFGKVLHLAAQAGVRYSLSQPRAYIESNLSGFINILEACRHHRPDHLVFASSSSVYGLNKEMPYDVRHNVDHPVSLYAASKKSNELMAHAYAHLFGIPVTGLRFFTVYGPWGRPDMALFLFTRAIMEGRPIEVYNQGEMERDFTYIDDIVEGVTRVLGTPPGGDGEWDPLKPDPSDSSAPYRIYNIGNSRPVKLLDFIHAIEKHTGRKAVMKLLPLQPGDVVKTWADVSRLKEDTGYAPSTSIDKGIRSFVEWYKAYYGKDF